MSQHADEDKTPLDLARRRVGSFSWLVFSYREGLAKGRLDQRLAPYAFHATSETSKCPMNLTCESCGNYTIMKPYQPKAGDQALATLGPDYAPNERVKVTIMGADKIPDAWVCRDDEDRTLIVRTRKLSALSVPRAKRCSLSGVLLPCNR
jgi:hypothetical protein